MAGITNAAYRRLCSEQGAGLYVCEMITSRGLVEGDATTRKMLVFDELETVRSVQLYGTDPAYVAQGDRDPLHGVRRGPRRPQLRLPGPQGDPQGWRSSVAVEAHPAGRDRRGRGEGCCALRRPRHDEDPQGDRRGPPDLPRRRPDRAGGGCCGHRAARPHRDPELLRHRRLGRHRSARGARRHPGARQRRHLGGCRRRADGRADRRRGRGRRTRLPGPALAVPRPGRCLRRRRMHRSNQPPSRSSARWPR